VRATGGGAPEKWWWRSEKTAWARDNFQLFFGAVVGLAAREIAHQAPSQRNRTAFHTAVSEAEVGTFSYRSGNLLLPKWEPSLTNEALTNEGEKGCWRIVVFEQTKSEPGRKTVRAKNGQSSSSARDFLLKITSTAGRS
jgi:hypothetical protein